MFINSKTNSINNYLIGTIFLIISAILTAANQVYYANKVQSISPFTFTCISFFITAAFFMMIAVRKQNDGRMKMKSNISTLILLNIFTAIAFLSFYYSLKYVEPAVVSAIEMGIGPLFALILIDGFKSANRIDKIIAIGACFGCLFLIWSVIVGTSLLSIHLVIGLILSIICGYGAVQATIYSKKLSDANWTSSEILAHRFYVIIITSFILALYQKNIGLHLLEHIPWILIISLTGVLLPLYALQVGIKYCDPFFVMISLTFVPIFTFIFQFFDPRIEKSIYIFVGIIILTMCGITSVFIKNKR